MMVRKKKHGERNKEERKLTKAQFGIFTAVPLPPPTANVKTNTIT